MMHNTEIKTGSVGTSPLSVSGPQPAWMTLNEARERAFTGEIVFEVDPELVAYLDNGVVYYAERASDASLGRRLLESGLVDVAQLERGTVKVGDVEHLGRLFDRDPSVDRDAVIVMVSTATEELIADIANHAIATVRVTAYRHHVSGVHRWFVAPFEAAAAPRTLGAVQLGGPVLDDALSMPFDGMEPDELTIDWIDPIDGVDNVLAFDAFDVSMFEVDVPVDVTADKIEADEVVELDDDVVELSFELAEFIDAIESTDALAPMTDTFIETETSITTEAFIATETSIEFEAFIETEVVIEPDTEVDREVDTEIVATAELADELLVIDEAVEAGQTIETIETIEAEMSIDTDPLVESVQTVEIAETSLFGDVLDAPTTYESLVENAPTVDEGRKPEYVVVWPEPSEPSSADTDQRAVDVEPQFVLPPLELVDEPESAGAGVNDDVAEAVRRAISVIESATIEAAATSSVGDGGAPQMGSASMAVPSASAVHPGFTGGFAPPTLETRAEALYERRAASSALAGQSEAVAPAADDPTAESGERRSALRRLIGSLRRKDS